MVEGERGGQAPPPEEQGLGGVVPPFRRSLRRGDVHGRDRLPAWVPRRIGIDAEEGGEGHRKTRLLPRLPDRRVFGPLPPVDEPPGDGPSGGGVFPPDEDDLLADLDDDVHGGKGATGQHFLLLCYKVYMNFASPAAIFVSSFIIALSGALMPGPLLAVTVRDTSRQGFVAAPLLVLGHGILEAGLLALILLGLAEWMRGDTATSVIALAGGAMLLWMAVNHYQTSRAHHQTFEGYSENLPSLSVWPSLVRLLVQKHFRYSSANLIIQAVRTHELLQPDLHGKSRDR